MQRFIQIVLFLLFFHFTFFKGQHNFSFLFLHFFIFCKKYLKYNSELRNIMSKNAVETDSSSSAQQNIKQQKSMNVQKNKAGFFSKITNDTSQRLKRLKKTIIGDFTYEPKNTFNSVYKQKIFSYLRAKCLSTYAELQEQKQRQKKFTSYDADFAKDMEFKNLKQMKQALLKLNTNIEAAEDSLQQSQSSLKNIKASYFNEIAFEFDKQRKSSVGWGLVLGSVICATIYRRGSIIRKSAVFWTSGLVFFQLSFRYNIDKYFDAVYPIFQQDAVKYVQAEQKQLIQKQSKKIRGESIMQQ